MILDIGTLMFNMTTGGKGGTPSWGTEMGQGEGYKFNFEKYEEMVTSLAYSCVDDIENVYLEFGKGGSRTKEYKLVTASLYKKVFVNGDIIPNAEFMLVLAKQIANESGFHIGRRTLKYSPNLKYNDKKINEDCFNKIKDFYGLNDKSAWFVYEINTKNQDELHFSLYIIDKEKPVDFKDSSERKNFVVDVIRSKYKDISSDIIGYNKIYYGAPGTGKSYKIDNEILKDLSEEERKDRVIRVTFHPEYTYNDFVGQIMPTIKKEDGIEKIIYEFKKGPFSLAIKKAYDNPTKMIYLIIEEMSRGNCAAIFGDIFQLLDRNSDGESTYFVNNEFITKDIISIINNQIKIPNNLTILGTVNTSDQNVYVMDTAFKRRFEWEYIPINPIGDAEDESKGFKNNADIKLRFREEDRIYKWVDLYMALNKFIASNEYLGLGEDKQIGQFFIKFEFDEKKDRNKIENKLLHYLWFDVQESSFKSEIRLFAKNITDFGDLFIKYRTNKQIFSDSFFELLNK